MKPTVRCISGVLTIVLHKVWRLVDTKLQIMTALWSLSVLRVFVIGRV